MRTPRWSTSVAMAGKISPFAAVKHDRFGEVDRGALDLAAKALGAGHDLGQLANASVDAGRHRLPVGDRRRPRDHIAVGQAAQRRGRVGIGGGHRRVPGHGARSRNGT